MRGGLPAVANDCGEWPGKAIVWIGYPILSVARVVDQRRGFVADDVEVSRR